MGFVIALLSIVPLLAIVATVILGVGIIAATSMAKTFGHMPPWIKLPYFSLCGTEEPEITVMQITIIGAGFVLFFCAVLYCVAFLSFASRAETQKKRLLYRVVVYCAGAAAAVCYAASVAMASFPLQYDLYHALHGYAEFTDSSRSHDTAGRVAWFSAVIFAILNEVATTAVPFLKRTRVRFARRFFLVVAVASGIAEKFCHPSLPTTKNVVETMFHAGAACEWVSLGSFAALIVTLALDLTTCLSLLSIKVPLFGNCACLTRMRLPQAVEMDEQ